MRHAILPLSLVWEAFGEKNGAARYAAFAQSIQGYRARMWREFRLRLSRGRNHGSEGRPLALTPSTR